MRHEMPVNLSRRQHLRQLGQWLTLASVATSSLANAAAVVDGIVYAHGYVNPPILLPDFVVTDSRGKQSQFHALLRDHVTAIQLIYTGCSSICPIQGATFSQLQTLIPAQKKQQIQLLSLSIDPLNDGPQELKHWLEKFSPQPGWHAVSPDVHAIDRIRAVFNQGRSDLNSHLSEVQIVNPQCELVWRSVELPSPESLANKLAVLS